MHKSGTLKMMETTRNKSQRGRFNIFLTPAIEINIIPSINLDVSHESI